MAGANGIAKFAEWDRENHLVPLAFTGPTFHKRNIYAPTGVVVLTGFQMLMDLLFTVATNSPITGPSVAETMNAIRASGGQTVDGYQFTINIENTDPVNPKTINFPAGWSPAALVIPAASYGTYTFELGATTTSNPTITLKSTLIGSPPGSPGVTSFNGRVGAVVSVLGDYNTNLVTNVSSVPGVTVGNALDNLQNQVNALDSTDIANVSTVPGVTVTNALDALQTQYTTGTVQSFNGRTGVVVPVAGDYTSTLVTNLSTNPGATVTAALNDLDATKLNAPVGVVDDIMVYDGANWVGSTAHTQGRVANLLLTNLNAIGVPANTPILSGSGWLVDKLAGTLDEAFTFRTNEGPSLLNGGAFNVEDYNATFGGANQCVLSVRATQTPSLAAARNMIIASNNSAVGAPYANFQVFRVNGDGTTRALAFTIWSSTTYKKDVTDLLVNSHLIQGINPATYRYVSQSSSVPKRAGVMYEDILPICPEVCDASEDSLSLDSNGLVGLLFSIVKHLEARVTALEAL